MSLSMVAALIASIIPFLKSYGMPHGWSPDPATLWRMARRNMPVAAADAVEWGSRRIDIAVLGLFFSPAVVGIYYVAQNVASLPAKLKTSFDPILGPVIASNLKDGDKAAVAKQVRQVGFWVIAAQLGVALALGNPGRSGDGPGRAGLRRRHRGARLPARRGGGRGDGRGQRGGADLCRAPPQHADQPGDARAGGRAGRRPDPAACASWNWPVMWQATGPAIGADAGAGFAAVAKSRLLCGILGAPRVRLALAVDLGRRRGERSSASSSILLPEWAELLFGIPAILVAFGAVLWTKGFGPRTASCSG